MPVCHKRKIIFVHIPKTAGTSISVALGLHGWDNFGSNKYSEELLYGYKDDPTNALQHLKAIEIRERIEHYNDYFSFAFIRNPFDKLVSEYYWQKKIDTIKEEMSFTDFIMNEVKPNLYNHQHYTPQSDFVCNEKGKIIVNFIGKYESLLEDLETVSLSIKEKLSIPYSNNTGRPGINFMSFYNKETLDFVKEVYEKDFEIGADF